MLDFILWPNNITVVEACDQLWWRHAQSQKISNNPKGIVHPKKYETKQKKSHHLDFLLWNIQDILRNVCKS